MKAENKNTCMVWLLYLVLASVTGLLGYNLFKYYTGPNYVASQYVKRLTEGHYARIYPLLESTSVDRAGSKSEVTAYYKKYYEKQHHLVTAKIIGIHAQEYQVVYIYNDGEEEGRLNLVKKKGKWQVIFPFTFNEIEVFAPNGCALYINGQKLQQDGSGRYTGKDILPGSYMLEARVPFTGYKDYYSLVKIPKDKNIVIPYDTGTLKIITAPALKIKVGTFEKLSKGNSTLFGDLLWGAYEIEVEDENGYLKRQHQKIKLEQPLLSCLMQDYNLTEKGETASNTFFEKFYEKYVMAIQTHDMNWLQDDIDKASMPQVCQSFSEWYIHKKDIQKVEFNYECLEKTMDKNGKLHQQIKETAVLYNREKDENHQDVIKVYKIVLTWDTTVNILGSKWQIEDRRLLESIVAVKDQQGRWVQY